MTVQALEQAFKARTYLSPQGDILDWETVHLVEHVVNPYISILYRDTDEDWTILLHDSQEAGVNIGTREQRAKCKRLVYGCQSSAGCLHGGCLPAGDGPGNWKKCKCWSDMEP